MIRRWRTGDQAAAADIYNRYEDRALRLADRKLGTYLRRRILPEDIMIKALQSVLRITAEQSCTLDRNQSLWGLVVQIVNRKVLGQAEFHTASKRDIRKEKGIGNGSTVDFPEPQCQDPTPEQLAMAADETDRICRRLNAESFTILVTWLEGYSIPEIAKELKCTRQTIMRKLNRILEFLRQWNNRDSEEDESEEGDSHEDNSHE